MGEKGGNEGGMVAPPPPSIWAWPEVQEWLDRMSLHVARFDQGFFGHMAVKPTQVATASGDLWEAIHGKMIPLKEVAQWLIALSRANRMQHGPLN